MICHCWPVDLQSKGSKASILTQAPFQLKLAQMGIKNPSDAKGLLVRYRRLSRSNSHPMAGTNPSALPFPCLEAIPSGLKAIPSTLEAIPGRLEAIPSTLEAINRLHPFLSIEMTRAVSEVSSQRRVLERMCGLPSGASGHRCTGHMCGRTGTND